METRVRGAVVRGRYQPYNLLYTLNARAPPPISGSVKTRPRSTFPLVMIITERADQIPNCIYLHKRNCIIYVLYTYVRVCDTITRFAFYKY